MSRYECTRCGVMVGTLDPPHLCADIAKRHARQATAVALVADILERAGTDDGDPRAAYEAVALDIVKALAGRDLGL